MNAKKVLEGLFTGLEIANSVRNSDSKMDPGVALSAVFSRRMSDEESFAASIESKIYLSRKDFPLLSSREEFRFVSGKNKLAGYLYRAEGVSKGLVLYVHGIKGQADDNYAIWQNRFVEAGYDVFAIDLTASGRSGGMGIDGLSQSAIDVSNAYKFVSTSPDIPREPVFFFGHSWGGYGVVASTGLGAKPSAICAFSGFDSPLKEMLGLPAERIGIPLDFKKEELVEALKMRCGELYDLSGSRSVEATDIPVFLAHGEFDNVVPLPASLYQNVRGADEKVLVPGKSHMDIFFDPKAIEVANAARELAKDRFGKLLRDIRQIPESEMREFEATFDRRMTSIVDENLFRMVDSFFLNYR